MTVPFIDCLLFLLIFFMLTTNFSVVSGLEIRLPQGTRMILDPRDKYWLASAVLMAMTLLGGLMNALGWALVVVHVGLAIWSGAFRRK